MRSAPALFALMFAFQAFGQIVVMPKVQVPSSPSVAQSAVSGTATDDGWAVVWSESDGVYGARLDKEGTHFLDRFRVGNEPSGLTSVGWCGTRLLVAWLDAPEQYSSGPLRMRRVLKGVPEDGEEIIDSGPVFDVQVAGSTSGAAIVWSTTTEIRAMRFDREGKPIDAAPVRLDLSAGFVSVGGEADGSYLVAWAEADRNPEYPCRLNSCPSVLEIRVVASRLEPSGAEPIVTAFSFRPIYELPAIGPYPHGFGWSPRSGLLLWDDYTTALIIPVSEDLRSGDPIPIPNGIATAAFDGRNFVVCANRGDQTYTLIIVSQFGGSFVRTGIAVPYAQVVAGFDGRALLVGPTVGDTIVAHGYAALVVDSYIFPDRRRRAVR